MADGLIFVWVAWIIWVILIFFSRPTYQQSFFSVWILILLSSMHITIQWAFINTTLMFIILFIGSMVAYAALVHTAYRLFCSLTVSIAYMSLKIWSIIMPVWIFLPKIVMFSVLISCLLVVLTKPVKSRLLIGLLGLSNGELFYNLIMTGYHMPVKIGTFAFFDQIIMVVTCIWGIYLFKTVRGFLHNWSPNGNVKHSFE